MWIERFCEYSFVCVIKHMAAWLLLEHTFPLFGYAVSVLQMTPTKSGESSVKCYGTNIGTLLIRVKYPVHTAR